MILSLNINKPDIRLSICSGIHYYSITYIDIYARILYWFFNSVLYLVYWFGMEFAGVISGNNGGVFRPPPARGEK